MNRFEVKYLVRTDDVPGLAAEMADFTVPDTNAGNGRGYGVFSIYWDSPDWSFFWEKVEGHKSRRKLRFRRYLDSDKVWLEIKQREDRTLQKKRLTLPIEEITRVFDPDGDGTSWDGAGQEPVATEALMMIHRFRLRPRIGVAYRRQALFGGFDPELRITFDSRIQYRATDLDISRPFRQGKYAMDPRVSILEIKYNNRAPVWLTKLIRRRELHIVRMSKYCSAVDREYFDNQLT